MPPSLDKFTGRVSLLEALKKACLSSNWKPSNPTRLINIHGLPGLGKSETAITFANINLDKFSLIWHIRCDDSNYEESYRLLAYSLNISTEKNSIDQIISQVHFKLSNTKDEKPWLLILDNVEKTVPIPERGGVVIITSQLEQVDSKTAILFPIQPFTHKETEEFLLKYLQPEQLDRLDLLQKELGGWPLLLFQLPHYLKGKPNKISDYLKEIKSIDPIFKNAKNAKYPKSLGQAFAIMIKDLQTTNPEAVQLLNYCAFLNPGNIDLTLFRSLQGDAPLQWSETTIDPLVNRSILRPIGKYEKQEVFNLHKSWQFVLRRKFKEDGNAKEQFSKTIDLLSKAIQEFNKQKFKTWDIGKIVADHLASMMKSSLWKDFSSPSAVLVLEQVGAWKICVWDGLLEIENFFVTSLNMRKKIYGEEHEETAAGYINLGQCLDYFGKYTEAFENYSKALEIYRNGDAKNVVTCHIYLSQNLQKNKSFKNALAPLKEALKICSTFDEKDPFTIACHNNLAICYRALGKFNKAFNHAERALKMAISIYGKSHEMTLKCQSVVGFCLMDVKNFQEAQVHLQNALNISIEIVGENCPSTIELYRNMGSFHDKLNKKATALRYHFKALEIAKTVYGEHNLNTANYYCFVGIIQ